MGKKIPIDTTNFTPGDECYVFKKNGDSLKRYFSFTDENHCSYFTESKEDAIYKAANLAYMFSGVPQVWSRFELISHSSIGSIVDYE
jgi:hypothetical protein